MADRDDADRGDRRKIFPENSVLVAIHSRIARVVGRVSVWQRV